ncbi:formate dehydrogenase, partial [bacterium]|nr:formate dehydrogenase [bacterium]
QKITIDEYYQYIFEHTAGLPEKAAREDLSPLEYMRKYGAFEVEKTSYKKHLTPLTDEQLKGTKVNKQTSSITKDGKTVGVKVNDYAYIGFPTPSRKQEFYSQTLVDWGWPEYKVPTYIKSHVHQDTINYEAGEFPLIPTFRLPTLIHSRSGNAKWLAEISNRNPIWMHTSDAQRLDLNNGALVRVNTDIGYFVDKVWITEGMKPGVVACSHHLGRWRRPQDAPSNRWATNVVSIKEQEKGKWRMRQLQDIQPHPSGDPDSQRIFWSDGGVHQNITFPVHPDPISGMHCWHQKVRIEKAYREDRYGDVFVDTEKSFKIYKEWLQLTRPAPGPGGLRRPLWLNRPLRPSEEMFYVNE